MSDMFSTFSRLAGLPLPDDDVQAAGDDLRDRDLFDIVSDLVGLPTTHTPEDIA